MIGVVLDRKSQRRLAPSTFKECLGCRAASSVLDSRLLLFVAPMCWIAGAAKENGAAERLRGKSGGGKRVGLNCAINQPPRRPRRGVPQEAGLYRSRGALAFGTVERSAGPPAREHHPGARRLDTARLARSALGGSRAAAMGSAAIVAAGGFRKLAGSELGRAALRKPGPAGLGSARPIETTAVRSWQ